MGGTTSKPKTLTRRELLAMTQKPRDFVNQLFQVMISQLTPKELLDLGNRAKCKDYVFVMADAIYKTFDAIKVEPTKDTKTGVLFYRKIGDITKGVGGQQTYEHCLSLAYFYVRIFQIFGALAITVSDDPSSGQVLGYLQRPLQDKKSELQIRGATAVQFGIPLTKGGYINKGDNRELDRRLESLKLNFIRTILNYVNQDNNRYKLSFDSNSRLQLLIGKGSNTAISIIYTTDNNNYVVGNLKISTERSRNLLLTNNQLIFTVSGFELRDESLQKVSKKITKSFSLKVDKSDDIFYARRTDMSADNENELVDKLEQIFERVNEDLEKKGVEPGQVQSRDVQTKTQYDVGVSEGLYTAFIQKYLEHKEKNTVPFCVARAIQLVDMNVLDFVSPTVIRTHICETNFEPTNGIVPKAGEGLDSSHGLKSVNQLFYSTYYIDKKGDADFQFQLKPDDGYLQFLSNLQGVFASDTKSLTKLSDLKMKDAGCDTLAKGKTLQISDPVAITNIKQTVDTLFKLQASHTEKVIDFMKNKLVEIKTVGGTSTIKIHPTLTKGGVSQINRLAFEARGILTDYYTKCELIYQAGSQIAKRTGKV